MLSTWRGRTRRRRTMLYKAWPFDMTKVTRPVHFWQGSADTLVPEIINKTVADKTPGASGTRSAVVVISLRSVTRMTFSHW